MYQRLLEFNGQSDTELLTVLLRSAEKAKSIADRFSIKDLSSAHRRELGLSQSEYDELMAAIELGKRVVDSKNHYQTTITSSTEAIEFCKQHFSVLIREATREEFHVVTLDTKNAIIDTHLVTVGTLDASLVHPREVFRVAIKDVCSSVVLVHNHPSGDSTISREDFAVTSRLDRIRQTDWNRRARSYCCCSQRLRQYSRSRID